MIRNISTFALLIVAANFFIANSITFYTSDNLNLDTLEVLTPNNHYTIENQLITTILSRYHYKKFELNDSLSSIIFDRFIRSLDYGKNYLLSLDINELYAS